jgi:prepilin-type N-terminal cleavage/methylation domain-containing protein
VIIKNGFSLIEVLMALMLTSVTLLGYMRLSGVALHQSQQAFTQTIALEQLRGMTDVIFIYPHQYGDLMADWNRDNQQLLPEGFGDIGSSGGQSVMSILWRSFDSCAWQCSLKPKVGFRCLSWKVIA